MKINLGSNNKRIEGYVNVDALDLPEVDIVQDLTEYPWKIDSDSVEEIYCCECLEHISFIETKSVLKECYRILKKGGILKIQVPDIEAMCRMIYRQCNCVPHKAENAEDYKANKDCPECLGRGIINPKRWKYAFTGAQKHKYDSHLAVFTYEILYNMLARVGFTYINKTPNIYKLIINCKK